MTREKEGANKGTKEEERGGRREKNTILRQSGDKGILCPKEKSASGAGKGEGG